MVRCMATNYDECPSVQCRHRVYTGAVRGDEVIHTPPICLLAQLYAKSISSNTDASLSAYTMTTVAGSVGVQERLVRTGETMVGRALDDVLTRNRLPIWGGRFLSCKSNQLSLTFGRHRQDDRPRSPECPHAYQMALEQLPVRLPAIVL